MRLDHIAIACRALDEGAAWLRDRLGVAPEGGGRHPLMGTHNRLLSLGPGEYLELIAIDPHAPVPGRPRWFGLDGFSGPPRVAGWVLRAPDGTPAPAGSAWETARRGDLSWRITIAGSGRMGGNGVVPALIDWGAAPHPAERLTDHGLRLGGLQLSGDGAADAARLADDPRITAVSGPEGLSATILTPRGEVVL